jgi:hypothetical protein
MEDTVVEELKLTVRKYAFRHAALCLQHERDNKTIVRLMKERDEARAQINKTARHLLASKRPQFEAFEAGVEQIRHELGVTITAARLALFKAIGAIEEVKRAAPEEAKRAATARDEARRIYRDENGFPLFYRDGDSSVHCVLRSDES